MFYSLTGNIIHTEPDLCVIECAGVGYACRTTLCTLERIQNLDVTTLYTHLAVREDAIDLFGFATLEELDCFKLLTSVSGVGSKYALAILSTLTSDQVALAIAAEDTKAFTRIKGVGNKIAQRIVMELKDKIVKEPSLMGSAGGGDFTSASVADSSSSEAVQALVVLGYTQSEAAQAVSKLDSSLPADELIKQGLRLLASRKL